MAGKANRACEIMREGEKGIVREYMRTDKKENARDDRNCETGRKRERSMDGERQREWMRRRVYEMQRRKDCECIRWGERRMNEPL